MSDTFREQRPYLRYVSGGPPSPVRNFAQEAADEKQHMNELFCVIYCSEDGDTSIAMMTRETLLTRLKEDYYGNMPIFQLKTGEHVNCGDTAGLYIIKGESVMPQPKLRVTEWDI